MRIVAGLAMSLLALAMISSCEEIKEQFPTAVAHRGCWVDGLVPENSVEAVSMAARDGSLVKSLKASVYEL